MIKTELTVAVSGLKKAKNDYGLIGICDRASARKCRYLGV